MKFRNLYEEGKQFLDKNFCDILLSFFIVGRDSNVLIMLWFVYMIILYFYIVQKFFEELCNFDIENVVNGGIDSNEEVLESGEDVEEEFFN